MVTVHPGVWGTVVCSGGALHRGGRTPGACKVRARVGASEVGSRGPGFRQKPCTVRVRCA